jgi:hypothetical protein
MQRLMIVLTAAMMSCFSATSFAQNGGGPQPQLSPNTQGGSPQTRPGEITPPSGSTMTNGSAAGTSSGTRGPNENRVQNGEGNGNRAQDHEK